MITVACVLRAGGDYDAEYVERLRSGVDSHLSGHAFVCLSDCAVSCESLPLTSDWPGWWAKMELFKLPGPVLYFDLDTVITGGLWAIAQQARGGVTMLSDFYRPERAQSGVMAWGGDLSWVYRQFAASPDEYMAQYRGDGELLADWLPDAARWQDVLPKRIVSRKVPPTRNPMEAVICFHGQPRPRDVGWIVS